MNCKHPIKVAFITLALGLGFLPVAQAQLAVSQAIASSCTIMDEFGELLKGTEPSASSFGVPAVEGDLVHILHATDGTIYPPATDGTPHVSNVLMDTSRIGLGVNPTHGQSGLFSTALSPRPGGNSKIFVRVFNAANLEDATFYADSELFTVKSWENKLMNAFIVATDQPLDEADDDGDGLHNSWENSYGLDSGNSDSDGDGMSDAEEIFAGTDPLDSDSAFEVMEATLQNGEFMHLCWNAAPGKTYDIEMCEDMTDPTASLVERIEVAEAGVMALNLFVGGPAVRGFYRLCVRQ